MSSILKFFPKRWGEIIQGLEVQKGGGVGGPGALSQLSRTWRVNHLAPLPRASRSASDKAFGGQRLNRPCLRCNAVNRREGPYVEISAIAFWISFDVIEP